MSNCRPHLSIETWLEKLDLTVYRPLLKDYNGVEDILWMSERDLKNIGIKNGSHRARMSTSLSILKDKYDKASVDNQTHINLDENTLKMEKTEKFSMCLEKPQSGVRSWPSSEPSSCRNTNNSSPGSRIESFFGIEATADELKKALEKELNLDTSDLRSYPWYHGTILRQRAEELVVREGDFIVRDCISQPGDFVITCKSKNTPLHFIIKKVILHPNTVYERVQYCFEADSFDSIADFVTYYVGSKCPLSESSGAVISHPINRTMPLSYYASRYGIQCQMHYAAKALEKLPVSSVTCDSSPLNQTIPEINNSQKILSKPKRFNMSEEEKFEVRNKVPKPLHHEEINCSSVLKPNLTRVGSDPMLSPNTERRTLEHRPNSGSFSSEVIKAAALFAVDKPPPKPSRVPSKRCLQKPFVLKRDRKVSIDSDSENSPQNFIQIPGESLAHVDFKRQISETRFSFLDRPSISDDGSISGVETFDRHFTLPQLNAESMFDPQKFRSSFLAPENSPLESYVLSKIKQTLLCTPAKILACHLTRKDLESVKNLQDVDLGLGVTSGLELFLLPQGEQLQKDLLERTESMKLFVAVLILTTPKEEERVKLLNHWIEVAIETRCALGNFYGFTSIMLGLTIPEVAGLQSTWLALRHSYTETAFAFETKLRPSLKMLQSSTGPDAPNTCFPYILSIILILQQHMSVMNIMEKQSYTEVICNNIITFSLPGSFSSDDFGLQLLADHLEAGRNIMQQIPVFRKNGELSLQSVKYDDMVSDMFCTEFHLRMLWGYRGSVVCSEERHQKFQKVLHLLHKKCNE